MMPKTFCPHCQSADVFARYSAPAHLTCKECGTQWGAGSGIVVLTEREGFLKRAHMYCDHANDPVDECPCEADCGCRKYGVCLQTVVPG